MFAVQYKNGGLSGRGLSGRGLSDRAKSTEGDGALRDEESIGR